MSRKRPTFAIPPGAKVLSAAIPAGAGRGGPAAGPRMPDRDNLQKGLSDALQGAVYLNDNQICGGAVRRLPGLPERVEVEVVELEDC
jgi:hypothetical protein